MVPDDLQRLCPRATPEGAAVYRALREHPDAPRWSHTLGDRLRDDDTAALEAFRIRLGAPPATPSDLPLATWRRVLPWLRDHADTPFEALPLQSRDTLARHPELLIPLDADLTRLIRYDTSGTTGPPVGVPCHPRTTAMTTLLVEEALRRNAVTLDVGPRPLVAHVCAQQVTWVFTTLFTAWGDAGFAKVNLHDPGWPPDRARRFLVDMAPQLVTGDPLAFAELLAWDVPIRPRALLSSATAFPPGLHDALVARFGCPVIDWYSTTETGPIAASTPEGMRLVCPDLVVEIVDADVRPLPEGELGEIVVSGGRNPYLPLVRWRTGDHARRVGDHLVDLQARRPIAWRTAEGGLVTPVDLAHALRPHLLSAFRFREEGGAPVLTVRPVPGQPLDTGALGAGFAGLLGRAVEVVVDPELDPKLAAWG